MELKVLRDYDANKDDGHGKASEGPKLHIRVMQT